jgi:hypothetical protein
MAITRKSDRIEISSTSHNEPSAGNAGVFWKRAFTKPTNHEGKKKKQQVNPALRLLAGR